jgi:signal transduction histidine kinase
VTELIDGASALRTGSAERASAGALGPRQPVLPSWATIRAQAWPLGVAILAVTLTVVLKSLSVTVDSSSGHATVSTATGLIGALAAFVFAERTRATHQLRDFLIALALSILSAADLILAAGPSLVNANPGGAWQWLTLTARLAGSAILVGAAFCPNFDLRAHRRLPRAIILAAAGAFALVAVGMFVWHSHLPALLASTASPRSGGAAASHGHLLLSYLQFLATLLAACAAVGFAAHSARAGDGLERSLAAGVTVLAIARLNYFLVPSAITSRLYAGDILKLAAYALILYGCLREFRALQRGLARRVALDERRRMARDMHDGLAQELAFIATHSQRLSQTGEDAATAVHLRAAAERALHDSRTTIAVLTSTDDAPLDLLIARTVETFRSRFGVDVELDLQRDVFVPAERRNSLLRILHEALTNAIRHGDAHQILVRLTGASGGSALRITDDGSGFDVSATVGAGRGLGLTSMGERAELLGGSLNVVSTPGEGTTVEVELP